MKATRAFGVIEEVGPHNGEYLIDLLDLISSLNEKSAFAIIIEDNFTLVRISETILYMRLNEEVRIYKLINTFPTFTN